MCIPQFIQPSCINEHLDIGHLGVCFFKYVFIDLRGGERERRENNDVRKKNPWVAFHKPAP